MAHKNSRLEEWTELSDDCHSQEWSLVLDEFSASSDSEEWSVLLASKEDDVLSCALSMTDDLEQTSRHSMATLPCDTEYDDTEYNADLYLDELYCRRKPRHGKRQLKHSLVKRYVRCIYSYGGGVWASCHDDYVFSMPRPVIDEKGFSYKTAVDELLPELMTRPVASLGHRKRWQDVKALLDRLVEEGVAKRCLDGEKMLSYGPRFGQYSRAPHDRVLYVVQPNGDKFFNNIAYVGCCINWKHVSSQDIEYILCTPVKQQDDDDGGGIHRRQYSYKKTNWTKEWDDCRHDFHNRSYKRAVLRSEIADALDDAS